MSLASTQPNWRRPAQAPGCACEQRDRRCTGASAAAIGAAERATVATGAGRRRSHRPVSAEARARRRRHGRCLAGRARRRRVRARGRAQAAADQPAAARSRAQRFARERDILARLEHPHIARLYDAGVTDDGLPYLAMEYVDGSRSPSIAMRTQLDIEARLRLFARCSTRCSSRTRTWSSTAT